MKVEFVKDNIVVNDRVYAAGDVAEVDERRAGVLIQMGHAKSSDNEPTSFQDSVQNGKENQTKKPGEKR